MMALGDIWGILVSWAAGKSLADLARRPALCSARITLKWTGLPPVPSDLSVALLPNRSYGCTLKSFVLDNTGPAPLIRTTFALDQPSDFKRRAVMTGSGVVEQFAPFAFPVVGIINFPTVDLSNESDDELQLTNVVQMLLPAGQQSVIDIYALITLGG